MKQLMENWRRFLNEGIDPRIQKQIDMLLALPDVGVVIASDASLGKGIMYVRIEDAETQQYSELTRNDAVVYKNRKVIQTGLPFGNVEILKTEEDQEGPCFDGWTVIGSEAQKGWGPLLYEVAIEYASQNGGGLTSDRFSVSQYAQAVWDKYEQRGDVDAQQMDTNHDPSASGAKVNKTVPQLTPDDKSDDCDQARAISKDGPDWHKNSTTKMYKKDSSEVMSALQKAGRLIVAGELTERDWQDESDKIKDHPRRKTRVLDTGANKETGGGKGHQKRDKKRGKSAPPGAGGV